MPTQALKEAAVEFLTLVAAGKVREAYDRHVGQDFRHHNPYFRGDAASLMEGMQTNAARNPNKVLEVQRALQDGELVAVFSRLRQRPGDLGAAVVHILRLRAVASSSSGTSARRCLRTLSTRTACSEPDED